MRDVKAEAKAITAIVDAFIAPFDAGFCNDPDAELLLESTVSLRDILIFANRYNADNYGVTEDVFKGHWGADLQAVIDKEQREKEGTA